MRRLIHLLTALRRPRRYREALKRRQDRQRSRALGRALMEHCRLMHWGYGLRHPDA